MSLHICIFQKIDSLVGDKGNIGAGVRNVLQVSANVGWCQAKGLNLTNNSLCEVFANTSI